VFVAIQQLSLCEKKKSFLQNVFLAKDSFVEQIEVQCQRTASLDSLISMVQIGIRIPEIFNFKE